MRGHWLKSQMKSLYNIENSQWDNTTLVIPKNILDSEDPNDLAVF